MLRRLISAVFVLGLVLALNGTAVSDVGKGALNPVEKYNPNQVTPGDFRDARPVQPTFKKPAEDIVQIAPGFDFPTPPQTYFCDFQNYTNGTPFYVWATPDAYGDSLHNMRFTADYNYYCTLKVAWLLMYAFYQTGDPDMRVYLWDDDGFGFPGAKLDSVDIIDPGAGLVGTNVLYWVGADFSAGGYVFSDGEEYHYGFQTIENTAGDTLWLASDDASGSSSNEQRASEWYGGAWGTMLNNWGLDVSFFIESERCCSEIPFTDCDYQSYWQNITYFWQVPSESSDRTEYGMKYEGGPGFDTLQFVDFMIYDASGFTNIIFGDDTVYVTVYGDDGGGLPDDGNVLASQTFAPGAYAAFPTWNTAVFNLVVTEDFHVGISTSADTTGVGTGYGENVLSSDGTDGVGRSEARQNDGTWGDLLSVAGIDVNFLIDPYVCIDEFHVCDWKACYGADVLFWRLPDVYGDLAQAQKFSLDGPECRVQDVCFEMYWNRYEYALPNYSTNSEVFLAPDAGGLPGAPVATIVVTPADWAAAGVVAPPDTGGPSTFQWVCFDFTPQNVNFFTDYWLGIRPLTNDPDSGIRTLSDDGGYFGPFPIGPCGPDVYAEDYLGAWEILGPAWGLPNLTAMVAEAYHCCAEFHGITCFPGEDWATYQHDYARTGHSFNPVSDAWCDMTLVWNYEDPTQGIFFCGPIVAGEGVVCAFTDHYVKFNLATGAVQYQLGPGPIPQLGSSMRCTPTVADITGYPNPMMFISGGDQNSILGYDYNTGAQVWSRDIGSVGPGGLFGQTRWGRFVILDDILYWGTDDGKVVAALALTGQLYTGWGDTTVAGNNPIDLTQSTGISGATDGSSLFYSTFAAGFTGDVYSIDASGGAINWQLSSAGGLQGAGLFAGLNPDPESFWSGPAYDNGDLFINANANGDFPADGLFYSLDAGNGFINWFTQSNYSRYNCPVVDAGFVFQPTLALWSPRPAGGDLLGFNRITGVIDRSAFGTGGGAFNSRMYTDAVESCEPEPVEDLIYVGSLDGFISCYNSFTMDELYRRRVSRGASGSSNNWIMGSAITAHPGTGETYMVHTDLWGDLMVLAKGDDRPRLEIQHYENQAPVEFGAALSIIVTIEDVFTNTGCADLTFTSVNADETSFGPSVPEFSSWTPVGEDLMNRSSTIADELTRGQLKMVRRAQDQDDNLITARDIAFGKETETRALGVPPWPAYLNSIVEPYVGQVLAPNDTTDLVLDVKQLGFTRGPHLFYVELGSTDPDFFLSDVTLKPQIQVNLVGGCLRDTTHLNFGSGAANLHVVRNTGMLADVNADNGNNPETFEIDGEIDALWMGTYIFGVSQHQLAFDIDYFGGTWDGWQADPNWCDNNCKPFLDAGVALGEFSDDGVAYTTLTGDLICASGVDSIQNFDLGGGWDWDNTGAPFDNALTMGLSVDQRTVGVVDADVAGAGGAALLNNATLCIFEFTERNGAAVPDWKFMLWADWDSYVPTATGTNDTMLRDGDISACWTAGVEDAGGGVPTSSGSAYGFIKVPFGCVGNYDGTPLKNVWTLDSDNSFYGASTGLYLDEAYPTYGSAGPGEFAMPGSIFAQRDQSMHATFTERDIAASETFDFGIALFGFNDIPDNLTKPVPEITALAKLVNAWAGFDRGNVNGDDVVDLVDIILLAGYVNAGGPGPVPFKHQGDVNADGSIDGLDVDYLIAYWFRCGPCPNGAFIF